MFSRDLKSIGVEWEESNKQKITVRYYKDYEGVNKSIIEKCRVLGVQGFCFGASGNSLWKNW